MSDEPSAANASNSTTAMAKLLNQLNLPTLALILISGGGNWFATERTSSEQKEELAKAFNEINELHGALNAFESRQKESLENQAALIRGQTTMFQNQMEVLKKIDQSGSKQN